MDTSFLELQSSPECLDEPARTTVLRDDVLESARRQVRDALLRFERTRTTSSSSSSSASGAVAPTWRALRRGRLELVEQLDAGAKRFMVVIVKLEEQDEEVTGLKRLTKRERDVVEGAARGLTDKGIAYELNVSPSTVRVLLSRARKRLSASSRAEVVRMFSELPADLAG